MPLTKLVQNFHCSDVGELTRQDAIVVPIVTQLSVPCPVRLLLAEGDFVQIQVLAGNTAEDTQYASNLPDATSGFIIV